MSMFQRLTSHTRLPTPLYVTIPLYQKINGTLIHTLDLTGVLTTQSSIDLYHKFNYCSLPDVTYVSKKSLPVDSRICHLWNKSSPYYDAHAQLIPENLTKSLTHHNA